MIYHPADSARSSPATTASPLPPEAVMPTYARISSLKKTSNGSPTRNVRFADQEASASCNSGSSSSSTSGSGSGPSSIDSQQNGTRPELFSNTLEVIEKSNSELEKTLQNNSPLAKPKNQPLPPSLVRLNPELTGNGHRHRMVDTIHNNKNSLAQEVIYEVEATEFTSSPSQSKRENPAENANENNLTRSASQTVLVKQGESEKNSSVGPSFPSISDLSIADIGVSNFKSLTAQKLMAGLSFNSIDTLLEVNAAAEARIKLNESTETVDFGVI